MPHCADEAVAVARFAGKPAREHLIRRALAVHIGCHKRACTLFVGAIDQPEITLLIELFAEVHIAATTPSAEGCAC